MSVRRETHAGIGSRLTDIAHRAVGARLANGDLALDATVGNGRDCLFLARVVGRAGRVFGFDIQASALTATHRLLESQGVAGRVRLFRASHHRLERHLPAAARGAIGAAMFNLGYRPGFDKRIVTRPCTTLPALVQAREFLAAGGILSVLAYPGHPGGAEENRSVDWWFEVRALAGDDVRTVTPAPAGSSAPRLFLLRRRA